MSDEHLISLQPGTVIAGRYEVVKCLGAGSMGLVYACRHRELAGHMVAVKVLFPEVAQDKIAAARFRNEIFASYGVSHPNVVRAYEYIRDGDLLAYTMEYVGGGDLADKLNLGKGGGVSISEIVQLLGEICGGLQAIHDAGIVHRDLKPENILITKDGHVKIADFGIARTRHGPKLTEHGGVVGTIDYVSPEYMLNSHVDWRSDIYAIGILTYEMMTGESPFRGDSVYATMTKRLKSDPVHPCTLRPECPPGLAEIILKAMHRDPEQRYQSMSEMFRDLQEFIPESERQASGYAQMPRPKTGAYAGPTVPPVIEAQSETLEPSTALAQRTSIGSARSPVGSVSPASRATPEYGGGYSGTGTAMHATSGSAGMNYAQATSSVTETVVIHPDSNEAGFLLDEDRTIHDPMKMERVLAYEDVLSKGWDEQAANASVDQGRRRGEDRAVSNPQFREASIVRSLWVDVVMLVLAVVLGVGLGFVALRTIFPDIMSRRSPQAVDIVTMP